MVFLLPLLVAALTGALAALLLVSAALVLSAIALRLRAGREAARAREMLWEARATLEGVNEGDRVTLVGTLRVAGAPCESFEDGAPVAAATAAGERAASGPSVMSARAEVLRIELQDGSVEIKGPVDVVAGSREVRPGAIHKLPSAGQQRILSGGGDSPAPAGPLRLRSLRSGDRVRATGVLGGAGDSGAAGGYRTSAGVRTLLVAPLAGDDEAAAIPLAFEGRPQVRGVVLAAAMGVRRRQDLAMGLAAAMTLGAMITGGFSWLRSTALTAEVPAKVVAHLGDDKACSALKDRYVIAMSRAAECARDEDCSVEMRGEQWFDLDDCFRFKNRRAPTVEADRIADRWLAERCVKHYEVCSFEPVTTCRQGRCVERPPTPVPEDWVRRDFHRQFTYFAPQEMWPPQFPHEEPHECPLGSYSEILKAKGATVTFSYGGFQPLTPEDISARRQAGILIQDETDAWTGEPRVRSARWVEQMLRGAPNTDPERTKHYSVVFGEELPCPPACLFPAAQGPTYLHFGASCNGQAACDVAHQIARSIRRW